MGMFQRIVEKASLTEDDYEDEYYEDDVYEDDDYTEEEADVTPIHAVASAPEVARIVTVWPKSFNDVQSFAEQFRKGLPVILNLSGTQEADRYRIVDFAAGVCFGLQGHLNQISNDVLLMTPRSVKMETHRPEAAPRF